ncbi:MAG: TetR/AcrR family transcriptional regulator [Chthoniobacterales bacterium]
MRYGKEHKQATHRKLLKVAATRFRKDGLDSVGVASLMADAGLTHGGFYSHFPSKEALINETLKIEMNERFLRAVEISKTGGIEAFIRYYLCPEHRDHPESGCPLAAFASEINRHAMATRKAYAKKLQGMLIYIETLLPPSNSEKAQAILATLVGGMQLARAVPDKKLSTQILHSTAKTACNLAKSTQRN